MQRLLIKYGMRVFIKWSSRRTLIARQQKKFWCLLNYSVYKPDGSINAGVLQEAVFSPIPFNIINDIPLNNRKVSAILYYSPRLRSFKNRIMSYRCEYIRCAYVGNIKTRKNPSIRTKKLLLNPFKKIHSFSVLHLMNLKKHIELIRQNVSRDLIGRISRCNA
jgi:hypothetical protein